MIVHILIGFFPGVAIGVLAAGAACAASKAERARDERIREEWQ